MWIHFGDKNNETESIWRIPWLPWKIKEKHINPPFSSMIFPLQAPVRDLTEEPWAFARSKKLYTVMCLSPCRGQWLGWKTLPLWPLCQGFFGSAPKRAIEVLFPEEYQNFKQGHHWGPRPCWILTVEDSYEATGLVFWYNIWVGFKASVSIPTIQTP